MNCCADYSRSRGSRQGVARVRTCFNLVGDTWQRPFSDPLPVDSRVCGNDGVTCCAPHTYQTETVSFPLRHCTLTAPIARVVLAKSWIPLMRVNVTTVMGYLMCPLTVHAADIGSTLGK